MTDGSGSTVRFDRLAGSRLDPREWSLGARVTLGALAAALLLGFVTAPAVTLEVVGIVTRQSYFEASIQAAVPLALAGIGGLYAEKSGVINIGIEGLLITSALVSVIVAELTIGSFGEFGAAWIGFVVAVLASTLFALLFAAVCIEFQADQIIAGLAVWLLALGFAPFAMTVMFESKNGGGAATFDQYSVPLLSEIPFVGAILFQGYPTTFMTFLVVPVAWYVLNHTPYGTWVKASGEHPEALDTAGVDVDRVRYAAIAVSGVLAGAGGTALTLASTGRFVGAGQTIVDGRGFIAIVAYLLGNYNPIGTFLSALLFAGAGSLETGLQPVSAIDLPSALIRIIPHVSVIVVLVAFGYTRIPARAGEHYESGEE